MIGSITLIFMLFRSHKKFSTTLHRLLLGLSISDIISSVAMSFASIPSPPSAIHWHSIGNMSLCQVQGFVFFIGHVASPLYNCSICIYYLIEIKYTHLQRHLDRIEVFLHAVPVLTALTLSTTLLSIKAFHPDVTNCFPFVCKYNPKVPCNEGYNDAEDVFSYIYVSLLWGVVPLVIFFSMITIYREVATQETRINQFTFGNRGSISAQRNTAAARNRAVAYSLAWVLTWLIYFCNLMIRMTRGDKAVPFVMAALQYTMLPLQGFFNFIVYIFPTLMRNLKRQELEGEVFHKRLIFSFRDTITSRGRPSMASRGSSRGRRSTQLRRMERISAVKETIQTCAPKEETDNESMNVIAVEQENQLITNNIV